MICDCCRRDVEYVRGSFWHGDARICLECLSQWYDLDNDQILSSDRVSIGNYVRLRHGLPPFVAVLALLLLTMTSTAQASRHCLGDAGVAQTESRRIGAKERDGCWAVDLHPSRSDVPLLMPQLLMPGPEPPAPVESWPDNDPIEAELRLLEADPSFSGAGDARSPEVRRPGLEECLQLLQWWQATMLLWWHRDADKH
jgi:hypothetical protein